MWSPINALFNLTPERQCIYNTSKLTPEQYNDFQARLRQNGSRSYNLLKGRLKIKGGETSIFSVKFDKTTPSIHDIVKLSTHASNKKMEKLNKDLAEKFNVPVFPLNKNENALFVKLLFWMPWNAKSKEEFTTKVRSRLESECVLPKTGEEQSHTLQGMYRQYAPLAKIWEDFNEKLYGFLFPPSKETPKA